MNEIEKALFIKQEVLMEATSQCNIALKGFEEAKNPPNKEVDIYQKAINFDKMSYLERINFYKENPLEYEKLVVKSEKFSELSYAERSRMYNTDPTRYEKLSSEGE